MTANIIQYVKERTIDGAKITYPSGTHSLYVTFCHFMSR